jgi:hypothetical protein
VWWFPAGTAGCLPFLDVGNVVIFPMRVSVRPVPDLATFARFESPRCMIFGEAVSPGQVADHLVLISTDGGGRLGAGRSYAHGTGRRRSQAGLRPPCTRRVRDSPFRPRVSKGVVTSGRRGPTASSTQLAESGVVWIVPGPDRPRLSQIHSRGRLTETPSYWPARKGLCFRVVPSITWSQRSQFDVRPGEHAVRAT